MIIVQDSREKTPWNFISYNWCKGQVIEKMSAGDYSLSGYKDLVCIERKRTVNELANNLGKKYEQFKSEMEKIIQYRFRYVVCEFTEQQLLIYPKGSNLPKNILSRLKISGKFLHKRVNEIQDNYGVEFIFCADRHEAKDKAMELLFEAKSIYDNENKNIKSDSYF